jgi:4-amino-4-deoxy-L-arabinose transferase-like glycosyltransferase
VTTTTLEAVWPRGLRRPRLPRPARFTKAELYDRVKPAASLGALLLLTAGLYFWGLSRNGNANQYYAAAVQAGTHSWKAFLFGSLDPANYITVDKPPASLWLMELSSRLFGFSSFSVLLPQALEGVAAVALLYATVRRWFGQSAALLSGLILAVTPVAALMFRFNNPDSLLVLLLVLAAYGVTRALERGGTRWLILAGTALGVAFLTKMLQGFLVLPAFGLVYLLAAPVALRRRLWQACLAGIALAGSAGWWVALVEVWPASARPFVGGSSNDSILQLVFGYNGLDRISSGGGGANFSGSPGILRLFNSLMGGQISWLLPAALISLVVGAVWTARRPRTDRTRTALLLWGGWLMVSAAIYSYMTGVIHPYYTNTVAPAIAVLVGVGATLLWRQRRQLVARLTLAVMLIATAGWSYSLLARSPSWHPWLRFAVLAGGALAAAVIIVAGAQLKRAALAALAATGLLASLAGPFAYTVSVIGTAETGSIVSAGPAVVSTGGFGGGPGTALPGGGNSAVSNALASLLERTAGRYSWVAATSSGTTAASLELATGKSVMAIGGFTGSDNSTTLANFEKLVARGKLHYFVVSGGFGGGSGRDAPTARFTPPSGGFRPSGAFGGGGPGNQGVASMIQTWVSNHFKSTTVGGSTVYDLTRRTSK